MSSLYLVFSKTLFKMNSRLSIVAVITLTAFAATCMTESLGHEERCQVIEGNGVRVDQCDGTKYLMCKDGRCQCPDPANQIYTYRNELIQQRSRRSPGKKGGGFKKVAAGAIAGAATYHVVSSAAKGGSIGFTTTPKPPKYQRIYSCYSRVGGQCALNYNNVETVDSGSTTTTTTPAASSTTEASVTTVASDNSTTTPAPSTTSTAAPVAAAQVAKLDLTKIPRCVQYAICKPGMPATTPSSNATISSASAGFHQRVDFDPRVGVCECADGYKRNSRDLCEKIAGTSGTAKTGTSFAVILATLAVNKMFV